MEKTIKENNRTTISVKKTTFQTFQQIGSREMTNDDVLLMLIGRYEKDQNKNINQNQNEKNK